MGINSSALPHRPWWNKLLPAVVLALELAVFHWRVLFRAGYVIPWDLRYFHLPHAAFIASSVSQGEFPWWDPYTYCGRPFAANIQTQLFYPPRWASIGCHLATGVDLLYCLEVELIAHIWLGGLLAWWLLRELGLQQPHALLGATVYQLGGFFSSQAQHIGVVSAGGWLPLVWLATLKLARHPSRWWTVVLAFATALTVLTGLPAMTVVAVVSGLALAAGLWLVKVTRPRLLLRCLVAFLMGGLLASVQLLPTVELNFHSISQYRADWMGAGGGLPLQSLVSLVLPNHYGIFDLSRYQGPWEPTFLYTYSSWLGLGLAAVAMLTWRREWHRLFTVLTLLFALAMLGESTPAGQLVLLAIPALIRAGLHPEFFLAAFSLSLAVLAALGAQVSLRRPVLAWGAVAVVAMDLVLVSSGRPMNAASVSQEPGVSREAFDGSPETLQAVRQLVQTGFPPWRIDTLEDSTHWAMTAPLTQIPSANGNDPMALARLIQARLAFCRGERWGAWYQVDDPASPMLDFLSVRYLISRRRLEAPHRAGLVELLELPGRWVYENPGALPRFHFVWRVAPASSLEEAVAWVRSRDFDPRAMAVVEGWPAGAQREFQQSELARIRVLSYRSNQVVLRVSAPAGGFLVSSEAYYPGWQAWIDGARVPVLLTNVAFRGVRVPAGEHLVVFVFRPWIFVWGGLLSLLSLALVLAYLRSPSAT